MTRLQSKLVTGTGTASINTSYTTNITAGSLLIAWTNTDAGAGTTFTFSSTGSPTWGQITPFFHSGFSMWLSIGYCQNAPAGATTVTVGFSNTGGFSDLAIAEYSGMATSGVFDTQTAGRTNTTSTTPTDAALTTAVANELITGWAVFGGASTRGAGSPFTLVQDDTTGLLTAIDYTKPTAGSQAAAWTSSVSQSTGTISAAFKPSAAAAVIPQVNMAPYTAY